MAAKRHGVGGKRGKAKSTAAWRQHRRGVKQRKNGISGNGNGGSGNMHQWHGVNA